MDRELPARAFFRYSVPIAPKPSRLRIDGRLAEWSPATRLPDLAALDGRAGFGDVYLAWEQGGLYVGLHVPGKANVVSHRQRPSNADALLLWIDTRDVRDIHRASRFCHHFIALPRGGGPKRQGATAWQAGIRRARERAPICDPKKLKVASAVAADSYSMELAIPAAALHGFDPTECPRLGFTYLLCDHEHGRQSWSAPMRMSFWHDPSTWATVELRTGR